MIEQRDGRWRARLRLKGQPPLSKTFATERAAREWHDRIGDSARSGLLADVLTGERTFGSMLRLYAERITPAKRGLRQELVRIRQLEAGPLADLKLSAISRRVLREHRDRRMRTICGGSWNRELSLIAQVLKFAVREHDAKLGVRELVEGLRGRESPGRSGRITIVAEATLIEAADKVAAWVGPMIKLSLALGTRRAETWALSHADIDRAAMAVRVRGTKTEGSLRTLPISEATLAVIDSLPRSLADSRILWQAEDPDDLTYVFRRTCRIARLPHTLHLCRHEAISRLAEAGASIPMLRAFSGHATLAMLARYARPQAEGLRSLIAA